MQSPRLRLSITPMNFEARIQIAWAARHTHRALSSSWQMIILELEKRRAKKVMVSV